MNQYQTDRIPVDKTLHHLDTALNTEKMKAVFQQQLYPDHSLCIETCKIERIKYKPQKNCHVSYRLYFNQSEKNNGDQLVCVRFYEQGGSISRFLKAGEKNQHQNLLHHIPELDCVTWIFPNDRKLNNLDLITDPTFLYHNVASKLVSKVYEGNWSAQEIEAEMIRYVPEQNCSVRVRLNVRHDPDGEQANLIAYGKTHYNQSGQQVYNIMRQIWESDLCRHGMLNIPEALIYHTQHRMLWIMGVPGIMLSELYDNQVLFLKSVEQCARQVAFLHQVPLQNSPGLSEDNLQQQLRKVDLLIKQFNVPCREAIATLIEKLMLLIRSVPSEKMTPLHGDLHLKNILVDNDTVYLIDLDNISLGNPLQDVGSFIAAILNLQIIGAIPKPLAEQSITVFLKAYNETIHFSVSTIDLRLYIATSLVVERIFRSFTRLKAGRMEIIEDLIQQAEMIMDTTFTPNWL